MAAVVPAAFDAGGGRVAEESKLPRQGGQARREGDAGTRSLRPDPCGCQTLEETDLRVSPEG